MRRDEEGILMGPVPPWEDPEEGGVSEDEALSEERYETVGARRPDWLEAQRRGQQAWAERTHGGHCLPVPPDRFARERQLVAGCRNVYSVAEALAHAAGAVQ